MKHTLSSFRRGRVLRFLCLFILAVMCAPAAMAAAASAPVGLPAAGGSHAGAAFLAAGLGGMMLLRAPADDSGGDNGGGGSKDDKPVTAAEAVAAIEDKTLPMSQRLSVALKALQGVAPTEQYTKVQADLTTAQSALKAKDKELSDALARITALEADAKANEQTIADLGRENKDLKAKEQDLDKRVDARVKEKMAAVGFPAGQLPPADEKVASTGSYAEALAEYGKITDPQKRAAYYQSHVVPFLNSNK